jgi:AcrR family transcriptional regulator
VKSPKPQIRDPEATKARILAASKKEFSRKGLGGARVDAIAAQAKSNKRMMYHYFGNKEQLFRITLEQAYSDFREAEAGLELEKEEPVAAIKKLVAFVWQYFLANPEFITLVNSILKIPTAPQISAGGLWAGCKTYSNAALKQVYSGKI